MKTSITNFLIRVLGFQKRIFRLIRVFLKQNISIFNYVLLGTLSVCLVAVSLFVVLNNPATIKPAENTSQITATQSSAIENTQSPTVAPTSTPVAHIYGNSPLIVLDCSSFNDNSYIEQVANEFGVINDIQGQYVKVHESQFVSTFNSMVSEGNAPNVVIAPNDILVKLGVFEDVTQVSSQITFNSAAVNAIRNDRVPLALEMYAYFNTG